MMCLQVMNDNSDEKVWVRIGRSPSSSMCMGGTGNHRLDQVAQSWPRRRGWMSWAYPRGSVLVSKEKARRSQACPRSSFQSQKRRCWQFWRLSLDLEQEALVVLGLSWCSVFALKRRHWLNLLTRSLICSLIYLLFLHFPMLILPLSAFSICIFFQKSQSSQKYIM